MRSSEGAEDDAEAGAAAIDKRRIGRRDTVVGIAACGLTPYVRGALARARKLRASTVFIVCAPEARCSVQADVVINPVVGPEVVTGSTRMKAGTATKLILNTLTTAAMIKIGKVFGNLMVDLRARSAKLRDRAERIVETVAGVSRSRARKLLAAAHGEARTAVVMHVRKVDFAEARKLLKRCGGILRKALAVPTPVRDRRPRKERS